MIRINLLPHREEAKKARREQFFVLAGLVSVLGLLVVFAGYTLIGGAISNQEAGNNYLKSEIALLDKDLDRDRGETVYLLSELVKQVPEGIYLKSLKQDGLKVNITGYAQSNARLSALMRNLEASPWLEAPQLIESKAVILNGRRINEFGMNFVLTRVQSEDVKEKK
jgi:type IV pilus assembly protein PilN